MSLRAMSARVATISPMERDWTVVPGYTDAHEVGRGGFAAVFRARSEQTGDLVALKVFSTSDVDKRRIQREIGALGRLAEIPNVVPVLDVTTASDGSPVMVMPFLPSTMAAEIEASGVAPEVAVGWLADIATALDRAALVDVHHRDVKPANVLIDADGHAHLADFGISSLAEMDTGTTTASAFSPPFAAPERFEARTDVDPVRSDVYSLAATTWAAIVGGAPFGTSTTGGVSGLIGRVMGNHLERPDSMPRPLYDVLRTGMALDPAARYGSASEMAAAAHASLLQPESFQDAADDDRTIVRLPTNALTGVVAALPHDGDAPTTDDRPEDGHPPDHEDLAATRSNARRITLIAACLLLLLVVGGVIALSSRHDPQVETASRSSDERKPIPESTTVPESTPPGPVLSDDAPVATIPPPATDTTDGFVPAPTVAGAEQTRPSAPTGGTGPTPVPAPAPVPQLGPAAGGSSGTIPAPTATLPSIVPTSCSIVDGKVDLSPGIAPWQMDPQNATMVAPISCQRSRGGPLAGSLMMKAYFPKLGYLGGETSGSGSISWSDGQSTQTTGRVNVMPAGDNTSYDVQLSLTFGSGFGAPGSANTSKLRVVGLFDPVVGRVIQINQMNGTFTWQG